MQRTLMAVIAVLIVLMMTTCCTKVQNTVAANSGVNGDYVVISQSSRVIMENNDG